MNAPVTVDPAPEQQRSSMLLDVPIRAVLLALGYQIFMGWIHHGRAETESQPTG